MDNHPIPQDVTHFQFRLIGDMTLKQFGYVAAGVILAWVALASPLFFLLKFILAGSCVLIGVVLAFVPIEGRPSDVMVVNFVKALFSPTQFVYKKNAKAAELPLRQGSGGQAKVMLQATPNAIVQSSHPKGSIFDKFKGINFQIPSITQPNKEEANPSTSSGLKETKVDTASAIDKKDEQLQNEAKTLAQELEKAKTQETATNDATQATKAHEKVTELEDQLQKVIADKQELEKKLLELQKAAGNKKDQVFVPTNMPVPAPTQNVRKIPKQMGAVAGAPLVPDVPNLITGVIKDPRGNVLSNILIEVKDKDGNPVRAFKTNQLGQFAAATPLLNGVYTIVFEDPEGKHSFDSVEISVSGEIISPFEIISIDAREKLRQELFGKQIT